MRKTESLSVNPELPGPVGGGGNRIATWETIRHFLCIIACTLAGLPSDPPGGNVCIQRQPCQPGAIQTPPTGPWCSPTVDYPRGVILQTFLKMTFGLARVGGAQPLGLPGAGGEEVLVVYGGFESISQMVMPLFIALQCILAALKIKFRPLTMVGKTTCPALARTSSLLTFSAHSPCPAKVTPTADVSPARFFFPQAIS